MSRRHSSDTRRTPPDVPPRLPTADECETLGQRVLGMTSARDSMAYISGSVSNSTDFARGDVHMAREHTGSTLSLTVELDGGQRASTTGTRFDDTGLQVLVHEAEAAAKQNVRPGIAEPFLPPQEYPTPPKTYFDTVEQAMAREGRAELFERTAIAAEKANLVTAGDLIYSLNSSALINSKGLFVYNRRSYAELSVTMRTKDGKGSGWAWGGFEDWRRVDTEAVINRAVDLALRSANPVAVEPGRYTVIMEPAAAASFVGWIFESLSARFADGGYTVFSKDPRGTNKIGLQMMDTRLGLVSDPWDSDMPRSPVTASGHLLKRVPWFERGVLTNLEYDWLYAREKNREPVRGLAPRGGRLTFDGATQTLEEMIASTKRGIWVNRFSGVRDINGRTLLLTGTTRDGTFLIENGRITKAIKNLRFLESPFFIFNKLEASGEPVRAAANAVVPRLKVRDFNFTSLTDAI